ncbi:hypothetical protein L9F63_006161 [Diploptera punctata]|uniref:Ionotropic glutamate receptor C-terminal domain-containing protein n=1 Tax=Diploptera punctata TaxID=6984 RepID=A0AAD8E4S7_DIPPU|nr:hypothetical protein L9F63_006161 [Diploptera punctata]
MGAILLTSICVVTRNDAAITNPEQVSSIEKSFIKCILEISRRYFDPDHPIGIVSYSNIPSSTGELKQDTTFKFITQQLLLEIYSSSKWTVTISNKYYSAEPLIVEDNNPYAVIIIMDDTKENILVSLVRMLIILTNKWYNPDAYIVIADMRIPNDGNIYHGYDFIFKFLWKCCRIANVVILTNVCDSDNSREFYIEVYSWLPELDMDIEKNEITSFGIIDYWKFGEDENGIFLKENVFPTKQGKDFKGLEINITGYVMAPHWAVKPDINISASNISDSKSIDIINILYGPAVDFLKTYSNSLNMKIKLCISIECALSSDIRGPYTWVSIPVDYQILPGALIDAYVFSTSNIRKIPQWQSILKVFTPSLWICVLISYVTFTFTLWFIESIIIKNKTVMMQCHNSKLIKCFLETMRPMFGSSGNINFRHTLSFLLFSVWLFYSLQINTAYQSSLVDFMTNPRYFPPLRHIKDIKESNYKVVKGDDIMDEEKLEILRMAGIENNINDSISDVTTVEQIENLAFLSRRSIVKYEATCEVDGRLCFVQMEESSHGHILGFGVRKGSFLLKPYIQIYQKLESTGIIKKWHDDFLRNTQSTRFVLDAHDLFIPLGLKHLQGTFYLLILGLLVSFFIFMCENVFSICMKQKF